MTDSPFTRLLHDGGPPCLRDFPFEGLIESVGMESIHGKAERKMNCAGCGKPIEQEYRIRYNLCTHCLRIKPNIKTKTATNEV